MWEHTCRISLSYRKVVRKNNFKSMHCPTTTFKNKFKGVWLKYFFYNFLPATPQMTHDIIMAVQPTLNQHSFSSQKYQLVSCSFEAYIDGSYSVDRINVSLVIPNNKMRVKWWLSVLLVGKIVHPFTLYAVLAYLKIELWTFAIFLR